MISFSAAVIGFVIFLGMLFLAIPVALSIFFTCFLAAVIYVGLPSLVTFGSTAWSTLNNFILTAIPLFILLGELLIKSSITHRMYNSLSKLITFLPGKLFHTNILASGLFASVSGSSVATTATIGTIALPELSKRKYDERINLGSIAAGATLGILIPPSINMIIYGSMTNTSIGNLFIAGFIPGVLLMILFMSYIIIRTKINPSLAGESMEENTLKEKFFMLLDLLPPLFIFLVVMGSIYLGYATPTESASMGVVGAFLLLILYKKFSFKVLHEAFMSTVKVSSMIIFIMLCAQFFNFIIGMLGLPRVLVEQISSMTTNKYVLLITLIIFYMILGCFLETLSMMIATVPIIIPLILFYEIDPVWFGIFFVLIMQISLITPPVGMNLYVLQGLRETGKIADVIYGSLPFVLIMVLLIILLIIFPEIALWLPNKVGFQTQ